MSYKCLVFLNDGKIENGHGECVKETSIRTKTIKHNQRPSMDLQNSEKIPHTGGVLQLGPKLKCLLVRCEWTS